MCSSSTPIRRRLATDEEDDSHLLQVFPAFASNLPASARLPVRADG
jgi:hypothetical protein